MALIVTADQRLAQQSAVDLVIAGPSGIGKTSLARTLDPGKTLLVDMEAGMLALDDWPGDSLDVRAASIALNLHPWDFLRALGALVSGPNPAADASRPYSAEHFAWAQKTLGARSEVLGKYDTLFFDSITEAARLAFSWAKAQPEAFNKEGKPDNRGAYGLLGQEMVGGGGLLNQLKHCPDKNVVFVGILEKKTDDFGRSSWQLQVDGGKTQLELPGIVDQVVSMVELKTDDGTSYRAFVCHTINPWGYPAKDRSGRLDVIEEPHLGKLIAKIKGAKRGDQMVYGLPAAQAASPEPKAPASDTHDDIPF
jgi:hypothetical protein